jgi:hypothetical protein
MLKTALFLLLSSLLCANEAEDIIKKVNHNMRGKTLYLKMQMQIQTKNHKRSMELESWSEGKKKNFVKILAPSRDYGITFLSLNGQMWQYIPKIERIIKIPASMMLQKWMGSDITNDDVVKQSSLVDDYIPTVLSKHGNTVTLSLIPKPDATVVWGKIIAEIDLSTYTSQKEIYYDDDGAKVRQFLYSKVKKFGQYYLPTLWKVKPFDAPGHLTTLKIEVAKYDAPIDPAYFNKSALKRFSN